MEPALPEGWGGQAVSMDDCMGARPIARPLKQGGVGGRKKSLQTPAEPKRNHWRNYVDRPLLQGSVSPPSPLCVAQHSSQVSGHMRPERLIVRRDRMLRIVALPFPPSTESIGSRSRYGGGYEGNVHSQGCFERKMLIMNDLFLFLTAMASKCQQLFLFLSFF